MDLSPTEIIISVLPILIAITFHEVAHGFAANKLGDPTAKMMGRLTLNPIPHIDLFGTILMPIMLYIFTHGHFVFGYAKPVPINPMNFRNPKKDMAISAAAGPAMNILLALVSKLVMIFVLTPLSFLLPQTIVSTIMDPLLLIFWQSAKINVILAVFNMIPIPPLDGGRVLTGFLPYKHAASFSRIEPYGFIIVILLIVTGIANYFVVPLINFFFNILHLQ